MRKHRKMVVTMASNPAPSTVSSSPTLGDVTTTTIMPKKSSENRRSNKPIMEKRRRARINNSLNELKTLILDATKKDPARHSKLEKADILEMTVKHLESLQRQQITMSAVTDPQVVNKFKAGFSECAGEVGRFPGLEPAVRRRLLQHLANCLNSTSTALGTTDLSSAANRISLSSGQSSNLQVHIFPSSASPDRGSNSNNSSSAIQNGTSSSSILLSTGSATGSVQLLPTRLPNGDIALVLPNICAAQQQRLSSPPSPSSAASSSSPPPSLTALTTPSRTASTGSAASSSNSPIAFERLSVNGAATAANSSNCHSSSSSVSFSNATALSSEDVCHSPSSSSHSSVYSAPVSPVSAYDSYVRPYSPPSKPLSLVVREEASYYSEEKPWRPW